MRVRLAGTAAIAHVRDRWRANCRAAVGQAATHSAATLVSAASMSPVERHAQFDVEPAADERQAQRLLRLGRDLDAQLALDALAGLKHHRRMPTDHFIRPALSVIARGIGLIHDGVAFQFAAAVRHAAAGQAAIRLLGRRRAGILVAGGRRAVTRRAGAGQELLHLLGRQPVHARRKRPRRTTHFATRHILVDGLRNFLAIGRAANHQRFVPEDVAGGKHPRPLGLIRVPVHLDAAARGGESPRLDLIGLHHATSQQHRVKLLAQQRSKSARVWQSSCSSGCRCPAAGSARFPHPALPAAIPPGVGS